MSHEPPPNEKKRWLDEPSNVTRMWRVFLVFCGLFLLLDVVDLWGARSEQEALHFKHHAHYAPEHWFGFYPIYAFLGVTLLVVGAKLLRKLVMRKEDYYDE